MKNFKVFFVLIFWMFSCKDKEPIKMESIAQKGDVIICNEGNFKWANASLSLYKPKAVDNKRIAHHIFKNKNGLPLGDVCQSMSYWNGNYYVVLNNSGKISVLDTYFKKKKDINGFKGARYILPVDTKAYVTDMYMNAVSVIDLITHQVTKKIPIKGWCNQMVSINNIIYITNIDSKYLYLLDVNTDQLTDSIAIGKGATYIQAYKNGAVVLRNKYYNKLGTKSELLFIETKTNAIVKSIAQDSMQYLASNTKGEDIVVNVANNIYKFKYNSTIDLLNPIINGNWDNIYQIGYANNDDIYVSDAKDYVSHGEIYHYNANGELENSFKAGIIPSYFLFR